MPPPLPASRAAARPRSGPSTSRQSRTGAATASTTRPLTAPAIVSTARRLIVTRGSPDPVLTTALSLLAYRAAARFSRTGIGTGLDQVAGADDHLALDPAGRVR